jgi:hypothetical protein
MTVSVRRRQLGLRIESLESRRLLAAVLPSANEQYMVELINLARANPAGYASTLGVALNEGVPATDTISTTPKQPLAINPNLTDSAIRHSDWMLATDQFSHTGAGNSTITQRIADSGYALSGQWTTGENLGFVGASPNVPDPTQATKDIHENLFVDKDVPNRGHRVIMLKDVFREVGIGVRSGVFTQSGTNFNSVMVTQDFGKTGTPFFLTGVAYSDRVVANRFYNPGEGLGGISIVAVRNSDGAKFSTTTWASGGYSLALEPGTYNVMASGTALGASQFLPGVVISTQNVKRDFIPGTVATAPEIEITGGTAVVGDGSVVPSPVNNTNFGTTAIGGASISKTFAIRNAGNATLSLTGNPRVRITGENASDFVVVTPPTSSLAAGDVTTFTVRFTPRVVGTRTATLSISSDDRDEAVYDFAIQATATGEPAIRVAGNDITIVDGDRTPATADFTSFGSVSVAEGVIPKTFVITNSGTAPLNLTGANPVTLTGTHAADYRVTSQPALRTLAPGASTSFTVQFDPIGMGDRSAIVMITSDDPRIGFYDFGVVGQGLVPKIQVAGNNVVIPDGDRTPISSDFTEFGSVAITGGPLEQTFSIRNTGNSPLSLTSSPIVKVLGAGAADFTVIQPTGLVNSNGMVSFTLRFKPSVAGLRQAIVSIASNAADFPAYDFMVQGTGVAPAILVKGNNLTILDGDRTPSTTDLTSFGEVLVSSGFVNRTFTITNAGTSPLNLTGTSPVTLSGSRVADFRVTSQPALRTLAPGASTSFTVQFDPIGMGDRNAIVTITSDDPRIAFYDFGIVGQGLTPMIQVVGNNVVIPDGDRTPVSGDFTEFGAVAVTGGLLDRTYTIRNTGNSPLSLTGSPIVNVLGAGAADFTVIQPSGIVNPNGTVSFTVRFNPSVAGLRQAIVSIASNAADFPAYDFLVQGTGVAPAILVRGNNQTILDGDRTPSTTDLTSFGEVLVSSGFVNRTFTITNAGTSSLALTGTNPVTLTGSRVADFRVTSQPALRTLAPGASTSFTVQFDPIGLGDRNAIVMITSDDPRITFYDFGIVGKGLAPAIQVTGNGISIPDGDRTPVATDLTNFGSVAVAGGFVDRTFTIKNTGNSPLTLTGTPLVSIAGAGAADFTVIQPTGTVNANASVSFTIRFNPSVANLRQAIVMISSNALDFPSFDFMIQGSGTV